MLFHVGEHEERGCSKRRLMLQEGQWGKRGGDFYETLEGRILGLGDYLEREGKRGILATAKG